MSMWSSDSDRDDPVAAAATTTTTSSCLSTLPPPRRRKHRWLRKGKNIGGGEADDVWRGAQWEAAWPRRARPVVLAGEDASPECGSGGAGEGGVGRARSLTDDDLEELKGCVDLGFGFSYEEIPELCGTLPALELCYSMSQRFLDDKQSPPPQAASPPAVPSSPAPPAVANWKISSPGDSPDEVKARLKYWAQAVACTVKLCS